jgi:hypothetical protein
MSIRIRNTLGTQPPPAPTHPDGSAYHFEMLFDGGAWRAYADEPADLLAELIPGYDLLPSPVDRAAARVGYAVRAQVAVQAQLTVERDLAGCADAERDLLLAPRDTPPAVQVWRAPVPLVLVRSFYRPAGPAPTPVEEPPGQIWWIDPADEVTLLSSLHRVGDITLAVADATAGTVPGPIPAGP